jgi:hypothetical protein
MQGTPTSCESKSWPDALTDRQQQPDRDSLVRECPLLAGHFSGQGRRRVRLRWMRSGRTVVLVEGVSDQVALEVLAARRGRDLATEGTFVVPMGGATSIGRFLERFGPHGFNVRLAGLSDAAEEGAFRRGLARARLGASLGRADMEARGFYLCVADRVASVERVIGEQGELGSVRSLQQQPAQRGRSIEQQLHRFMGTRGGRKMHTPDCWWRRWI